MKLALKHLGLCVLVCMLCRPFGNSPDNAFLAGIVAGAIMILIQRDVK